MSADICPSCKKGNYTHGSAIYDYYSCGHALDKIDTKIVSYKSPYQPYKERYKNGK